MEDFIRLLKTLSEARGPSGFEDEVREVVIKEMGPHVDEVVVDRWGNVIGVKRGNSNYRAMVAAHIDEIGLVVDHVDKEGFLRIRPIGGVERGDSRGAAGVGAGRRWEVGEGRRGGHAAARHAVWQGEGGS
jgi:Cellulase M and related proteins